MLKLTLSTSKQHPFTSSAAATLYDTKITEAEETVRKLKASLQYAQQRAEYLKTLKRKHRLRYYRKIKHKVDQ